MQEKKEGRGEDSEPILFDGDSSILLGVFDGMGGAGSAECVSDYSHDGINMTNAYVGSRIIRDAIERYVTDNPSILVEQDLQSKLTDIISSRYKEEKSKYPQLTKSALRSSLIKEYPTTMAIACITRSESDYSIDSYWAGDSRNYVWTREGLFQISIDDLTGNIDPMQNLSEDAPMSNCLQANAPFKINHKKISFKLGKQFVVISATDGCFGYYPSPMDFEIALIVSLRKAKSIDSLRDNLSAAFAQVTADDFSFSIAAIGFKDFSDLKSLLSKPSTLIKDYYRKREQLTTLLNQVEKQRTIVERRLNELWPEYKKNYLNCMNE